MTAMLTGVAAATALGNAPEWVQLLPLGEIRTRPHDGRATWFMNDPQAVIARTRELGRDLPVDYDHQTDNAAANGKPAPAAGWIKEIEARPDGIYGRVSWTARARAHLESREYRFLSPVFQFEKGSRRVIRLLRAALTNDPALYLKAVASAKASASAAAALALSPAENELCERFGLDPADFLATRDSDT